MKKQNSFLLIFIDGIGIGKDDAEFNPYVKYGFNTFTHFFGKIPVQPFEKISAGDKHLFSADALLGVEGLPQSGTGQTAIFCGVNAPQIVGKHFGPFPYSTLLPIIEKENLFRYFRERNKKSFFMNAYPKVFFEYINSGKKRLSVTSLCSLLNGIKLNKSTEVWRGKALSAEITGARWNKKLGYKLPVIQPKTAARRLLRAAYENDFTAYEYFLTDHIGHGRYEENTETTLKILDEFLFTIFSEYDGERMSIILCSDHGNSEDLSVKTHTFNPVVMISAGKHGKYFMESIQNISQIKSAIVQCAF